MTNAVIVAISGSGGVYDTGVQFRKQAVNAICDRRDRIAWKDCQGVHHKAALVLNKHQIVGVDHCIRSTCDTRHITVKQDSTRIEESTSKCTNSRDGGA